MPSPQFKIRKINGVTEIRLADDPLLRAELSAVWKKYAPLLAEPAGRIPAFDELKKDPRFLDFIECAENAGKTFSYQLLIVARKDDILAKEVILVDENQKVHGISRWTPSGGIEFVRPD